MDNVIQHTKHCTRIGKVKNGEQNPPEVFRDFEIRCSDISPGGNSASRNFKYYRSFWKSRDKQVVAHVNFMNECGATDIQAEIVIFCDNCSSAVREGDLEISALQALCVDCVDNGKA